jgi:hypothetical protein
MALKIELSEAAFQKQVTDLATLAGWHWMHLERMGNAAGQWRTPVSGPLGKGWPDLVFVRHGRLLFVELKRSGMALSESQAAVMRVLAEVAPFYVWRPNDWNQILEVLTGQPEDVGAH